MIGLCLADLQRMGFLAYLPCWLTLPMPLVKGPWCLAGWVLSVDPVPPMLPSLAVRSPRLVDCLTTSSSGYLPGYRSSRHPYCTVVSCSYWVLLQSGKPRPRCIVCGDSLPCMTCCARCDQLAGKSLFGPPAPCPKPPIQNISHRCATILKGFLGAERLCVNNMHMVDYRPLATFSPMDIDFC